MQKLATCSVKKFLDCFWIVQNSFFDQIWFHQSYIFVGDIVKVSGSIISLMTFLLYIGLSLSATAFNDGVNGQKLVRQNIKFQLNNL